MPDKHPAKNCHGTDGAKKFVRLIKQAVGEDKEFYPVHRSLLFSSDNTTLFISPGKFKIDPKNNEFLYSNLHDKKTQMLYESCDEDTQQIAKGIKVKLTYTFSGAGQTFTPYIIVTGLTERELPKDECPSGIFKVPMPGLCMEWNHDPTCNDIGYAVFSRNTVSEELVHLKNHEHYHNDLYKPTINAIRNSTHKFDVEVSEDMPDELSSVGWNDGD
eukprot:3467171-Ditylum_brightwellii.AAC.1